MSERIIIYIKANSTFFHGPHTIGSESNLMSLLVVCYVLKATVFRLFQSKHKFIILSKVLMDSLLCKIKFTNVYRVGIYTINV